jgi:hypothetical protein
MQSRALTFALAGVLACLTSRQAPAQTQSPPSTPSPVSTPPPPLPAPPARVSDPDPAEVAADVLVVRPLGVAATAVGAVIFVLALPFAAIAGDVDKTARTLVGKPARFTFTRPLGDFENYDP